MGAGGRGLVSRNKGAVKKFRGGGKVKAAWSLWLQNICGKNGMALDGTG